MYGRFYSILVILLWLGMMTWLVTQKMLPSLLTGDPPNYERIMAAKKNESNVGWWINVNDKRVGWAVNGMTTNEDEMRVLSGWIHFDRLPLQEDAPGWLGTMAKMANLGALDLSLDCDSKVYIDPLGRLTLWEATIHLEEMKNFIRARGTVDKNKLKVDVRVAGASYETEMDFNREALVNDAFSPETQLPGLQWHQSWTVELCNPLKSPRAPVQVLRACVEDVKHMQWEGKWHRCWVVIYRDMPGSASGVSGGIRGRLWVLPDGTVIKQDADVFGGTVVFDRIPGDKAKELVERAEKLEEASRLPDPSPHD